MTSHGPGEDIYESQDELTVRHFPSDESNQSLGDRYQCWRESWGGGRHIIQTIRFQSGPVKERNINGIDEITLLEILAHRLTCIQDGEGCHDDNEEAIVHIRHAQECLARRLKDQGAS